MPIKRNLLGGNVTETGISSRNDLATSFYSQVISELRMEVKKLVIVHLFSFPCPDAPPKTQRSGGVNQKFDCERMDICCFITFSKNPLY